MTQNIGTYDEAVTGSKIYVAFLSFERDIPNLRETFVENAKKNSKVNPP
jgi:hypothetical protein